MKKHSISIIFKTILIGVLLSIVIVWIFLENRPIDHNQMRCDMSGILFVVPVVYGIGLIPMCLPIFLNVYENIRNSYFYSFSTFFGLLLLTNFMMIIESLFGDIEVLLFLILELPFVLVLIYSFVKFRKRYAE